ncbi:MAG: sulfatase-like hydrolase/transferase [Lentimonas sp.]
MNKHLTKAIIGIALLPSLVPLVSAKPSQPSILWIITDDQRVDSVQYYNEKVYGTSDSPLGYVESPNIDKLASEGVLFTQAICNSPVCGPSRGSMHSGRYPFRNGHYAFELTHQEPDFVKPAVAQTLRDHGYATAGFGKDDHYIYKWGPGQGFHDAGFFDHRVHFKGDLQANKIGDLFTKAKYDYSGGAPKVIGTSEYVLYPDGSEKSYLLTRKDGELSEADKATKAQIDEEFGILRAYTRANQNLILGGENPKPAGETIDAYIVDEFVSYLANANKPFNTLAGAAAHGADTSKPQFLSLGFHLPHTPVLPPKSYRDRFRTKTYTVPEFNKADLEGLPDQLKTVYKVGKVDDMTDAEKQSLIQDYYAFCAYGDALIGEAVEAFKDYCQENEQDYLIIYTIGDHGWHLGEQGTSAKFGPWRQSIQNAAIVVSSDKNKVKPGTTYEDMVEFVDFAPTMLQAGGVDIEDPDMEYLDGYSLTDVLEGAKPKREYALGEINLVGGPRAYIHTERFRFSMRTRPYHSPANGKQIGKDIEWALNVPAEKAELALYDLKHDPLERNNVANDPEYRELAAWFRNKLGTIVLGDGRVECDWSKANTYSHSNFAKGADDKQLKIPANLIPADSLSN